MSFPYALVPYGFEWGPAKVERLGSVDERGLVIGIVTKSQRLEVYVSSKGRSMRVFDRINGSELTRRPVCGCGAEVDVFIDSKPFCADCGVKVLDALHRPLALAA